MSTCKSCGAPIRWATTTTGKAIPLDLQPSEQGNILLVGDTAHYASSDALRAMSPRHKAHFASCPNANGHRKPRAMP